jgi:AraC family transcriptional regulator
MNRPAESVMSLPTRSVPVTMGSPHFRSLELDGFSVTEAWFPAGEVLPRHTHERPCVAVMLDGSFDLRFTGKSFHCSPTTVFTEPAGETHANFMGSGGAHVLVVQPDPAHVELLRPFGGLLSQATHRHHPGMVERALRLAGELDGIDDLSALAAEGIVLEMLVGLTRLDRGDHPSPPAWLRQAQELLHEHFAEPLRTTEVARAVGVHPAHLARGFRIHFRLSMGSYVRRLRLDWAARELVRSEVSLAALALASGFADQSHFTRFFKRYTGLTPNAYRRMMRH